MRYEALCCLALSLVPLAATPLAAQQPPPVLSDYVFVHDIEEHRVVISSPFGFNDTQRGVDNLYAWAEWACRLYRRRAVGALNERQIPGTGCDLVNTAVHPQVNNPQSLTQQDRNACQVVHLYACAMR